MRFMQHVFKQVTNNASIFHVSHKGKLLKTSSPQIWSLPYHMLLASAAVKRVSVLQNKVVFHNFETAHAVVEYKGKIISQVANPL